MTRVGPRICPDVTPLLRTVRVHDLSVPGNLSRVSWKLSRTVLRGGTNSNVGPLLGQMRTNGKKAPYRIVRRAGGVFAFAGIWELEKQAGATEPRFAIITTRANDLMRPIHLRMPVILSSDQERIWLSANTPVSELLALLEPAPSADLPAY